MSSRERQCLLCGMLNPVQSASIYDRELAQYCSKCDSSLFEQGDGHVLRVDIAHQQETVQQALAKLERALEHCWQGHESRIRLIVGGGRIHDAVLGQLWYLRKQGIVLDYSEENGNPGAITLTIRE